MFCLKKNDQVVLLPSLYLNSRDLTLIIFHNYRSPQGLRGKRSAEPYYGYYGQYSWPSYSAPGFTATTWGARGKRSADPEPYYGYGYGLGYYGHGHLGIAGHPGLATSFVAR